MAKVNTCGICPVKVRHVAGLYCMLTIWGEQKSKKKRVTRIARITVTTRRTKKDQRNKKESKKQNEE